MAEMMAPPDSTETPVPCANGCGVVVTPAASHHYTMALSNARIAHVDMRHCCSPECRLEYACSDGGSDPPPAPIRAPEVYTREDGTEGVRMPFETIPCPRCCSPREDNDAPCFTLIALADGVIPAEFDHDAAKCVCEGCWGRGEIDHTPWFVHSDDPAHAHVVDGPVLLHVAESAPGELFSLSAHKHGVAIADPRHVKEQWQFENAAAVNEWSATPIEADEHHETRQTFEAMRAGLPPAQAKEAARRILERRKAGAA